MSMPSFPHNGADMTRDDALTMIIASIAMEELALSHILNAEGEKLQYILGTLPGPGPCACPQEVLAVNKSVTALVEAVTENQMLLKNKLSQVLEFCPPPPPACKPEPSPCPTPCRTDPCAPQCSPPRPSPCRMPPRERSAMQLVGQRERMLWEPDCRLPWRVRCCVGNGTGWDASAPAQIQLTPGKAYSVQYTLNASATSPAEGRIFIRQSPCGTFTDVLPLHFSIGRPAHSQETLHYACVLHPCMSARRSAALSLLLEAKAPLYVERAIMDVVEL